MGMRWKFESLLRGYIFIVLILLGWAVWASAQQPATNAPAAVPTNQIGAIAAKLGNLERELEIGRAHV